jgi:putative ABC transport system permease protein
MQLLILAWKSLLNCRATALLTLLSISFSVLLLVGVERLRTEARESFANTISGTDLILGARSGAVQLLLYSVFHIGDATNNISWKSYQDIAAMPRVDWTIPITLGDSHRGFRVVGTDQSYFTHYRHGQNQPLEFARGGPFQDLFDVVVGAEVAKSLGYDLGDPVVVAHGASDVSFARHDDKPFRVVGILERSGTPLDRALYVSLQAIEAIHADWHHGGPPPPGHSIPAGQVREMDLTPRAITAALIGLKARIATFQVQRHINEYPEEPLTAILPGVALSQLWGLVGVAENALLLVSACVVIVGLIGMLTALLSSLNERRREMAILRSVGARPAHVFALIMGEAFALTTIGVLTGVALLYALLFLTRQLIEYRFGIHLAQTGLSAHELMLLGLVLLAGLLVGILPSYRAYRLSLADGLSIRI